MNAPALNQSKARKVLSGVVEMAHGSGGRATSMLIDQIFLPAFDNPILRQMNDQAILPNPGERLVTATDSHVISPLFFPGGDIGSLSVHGTINDLAMGGAKPLYLTAGFILEEGFSLEQLRQIAESMGAAARACNTSIVTGDTKVVERGHGDGVYINTTGIGSVASSISMGTDQIRPGHKILVSGSLGDHGTTILSARQNIPLSSDLTSDSQALHDLVEAMLAAVPDISCMRDPTRGGVAAALNELAQSAGVGMRLEESRIPVKDAVSATSEILGLDPLYIANEGKLLAFCPPEQADKLLACMRNHPKGHDAAIIGEVVKDKQCFVQLNTCFGSSRLVDWRYADPLPRIC